MFVPETPITNHPNLPTQVPLVAGFHDDRNRLSYYQPHLSELNSVNTPLTKFFPINGDYTSIPQCEYREITKFLQDIPTRQGFIRSDFSSAKLSKEGRILNSHDPADIKQTFAILVANHIETERHLGNRIAVREHIPHNTEVRYFIRDGEILYHQLHDDLTNYPEDQAQSVAEQFDHLAWSVDFIKHELTGEWYCIDMGLDGVYPSETGWTAISEHPDKSYSPEQYTSKLPAPDRFSYIQ